MKTIEYVLLGGLDIAVIIWLVMSYMKYWDVITETKNNYYYKVRANFNNAVIAFVVVAVINVVVLL